MRFSGVALLLAIAVVSFAAVDGFLFSSATYANMFSTFMKTNAKRYDAKAFASRLLTFKHNVDFITQNNQASPSFKMAVNEFADMSAAEFRKTMFGAIPPKNGGGAAVTAPSFAEVEESLTNSPRKPVKAKDVPKSWDWRKFERKVITPVKHQQQCGSCWAFTAAAVIESAIGIHKGIESPSLSDQAILSCTPDSFDNIGCGGGWYSNSFRAIRGGLNMIALESDFPYKMKVTKDICDSVKAKSLPYKIKSATTAGYKDRDVITNLYNYGPLGVAIDASKMQFLGKGVIVGPSNCSGGVTHAVTLVGFGEENGTPYYLIKNSWGKRWGDEGFFRIERHEKIDTCQMRSHTSYIVLE